MRFLQQRAFTIAAIVCLVLTFYLLMTGYYVATVFAVFLVIIVVLLIELIAAVQYGIALLEHWQTRWEEDQRIQKERESYVR